MFGNLRNEVPTKFYYFVVEFFLTVKEMCPPHQALAAFLTSNDETCSGEWPRLLALTRVLCKAQRCSDRVAIAIRKEKYGAFKLRSTARVVP